MAENATNPNVGLEELPLASLKGGFQVAEFADPEPSADAAGGALLSGCAAPSPRVPCPAAADPSRARAAGPLATRFVDSKPAVRKAAYAELAELFEAATSEEDLAFEEHQAVLGKLLADNAPLCHESAIAAVAAFGGKASDAAVQAIAAATSKTIVEKHAAGKCSERAVEALLRFIEAGASEAVQAALLEGAAHKVPKTAKAAAKAFSTALHAFGAAPFELKAVPAPTLVGLLEHRDKGVRDEGAALVGYLRLYRGDGFFKDFKGYSEEKIGALKAAPLPLSNAEGFRTTRATARQVATAGADGAAVLAQAQAAAAAPQVLDRRVATPRPPRAHHLTAAGTTAGTATSPPLRIRQVEAFDLLAKLPRSRGSATADLWEKELGAEKWQQRKAAAELPGSLASENPVLAEADYAEVGRGLRKVFTDSNINVVATAVRSIGALARALGKGVGKEARRLAPALLEKGADKNKVVSEAVRLTLEAFVAAKCVCLAELVELCTEGKPPALSSATAAAPTVQGNPNVHITALRWIRFAVADGASADPAAAKEAKPPAALTDAVLPKTDSASPDVRSAAFEVLVEVAKQAGGIAAAWSWLESLPAKKSAKVQELLDPSAKPAAAAPKLAEPAAPPAAAKEHAAAAPAAPKAAPPKAAPPPAPPAAPPRARPSASKPAAAKPAAAKSAAAKSGGPKAKLEEWAEPPVPRGAEELASKAGELGLPPPAIVEQLGDSAWSTQLEGAAALAAFATELEPEKRAGDAGAEIAELLLERIERTATAGSTGEKNVQVMGKLLEAASAVLSGFELVSRRSSARVVRVGCSALVPSLYLPCTFPVPSLYLPCRCALAARRSARSRRRLWRRRR